ncbi:MULTISPECIES: PepSY-associated TM helix domain-containing protein [unclassified Halomonas]|uniref:PepSY-associated TM helix domain-containing protein n=1 Tax=unclassified Halomonas TaxID=2609666 RepID=UPI00131C5393|nr:MULTISPECIES: PepSY-associated TM helix domain-containing protein [unclassified Halomonas]
MAQLHTWCGLLAAWLLFAVFLTGTLSYFKESISLWMQPELPSVATNVEWDNRRLADYWQHYLAEHAPSARSWQITFPNERMPVSTAVWFGVDGREQSVLNPITMELVTPRETLGGDFFYRFHFQLHHLPAVYGRWIIGVATMMMFVAIISGVITHQKILRDFFAFRAHKGARSWLDAHNACSVLTLPFQIMITYTGLITLMSFYMPWGVETAFPDADARRQAIGELHAFPLAGPATGQPAVLHALGELIDDAEIHWQKPVQAVRVSHPSDAGARVVAWQSALEELSAHRPQRLYEASSGALLEDTQPQRIDEQAHGVMVGLHAGRFADWGMRWIYFALGAAGCGMVATGLLLWTAKRRRKKGSVVGIWCVERLNITTLAGMPIAVLALLASNRLLPVELSGRAQWEIHVFFAAWLLALLHAISRRSTLQAWREQLMLVALLLLCLPMLDVLTPSYDVQGDLAAGNWQRISLDLMCLVGAFIIMWQFRRSDKKVMSCVQAVVKGAP